MSLVREYMNKKFSVPDLEAELRKLIKSYNKHTNKYLFLSVCDITKQIPKIALGPDDYFFVHDFLCSIKEKHIDFYIETVGGSGEAVEDIVRFLRNKFESLRFVIAGEAKSAGTILVLSGDEILMTDTASLGPIDAQIKIGRSQISAYDYMEWVSERKKEADDNGRLNPFDAAMIAQISPGEIENVSNALDFAKDLVKEWLVKYKFKNWHTTETTKSPVTDEMKTKRASEIGTALTNRTKWRSHNRSIKIQDLHEIGLKITCIEDDKTLLDIVNRIHTIYKILFDNTTAYKVYCTADNIIVLHAAPNKSAQVTSVPKGPFNIPIPKEPEVILIDYTCPSCKKKHKLYAKFIKNDKIEKDIKQQGYKPFPKNSQLKCSCGYESNISGIKNEIESKEKRKMVF